MAKERKSKNQRTIRLVLDINPKGKITSENITLEEVNLFNEKELKQNFTFEIKVPQKAKLVQINIDGSKIEGEELLKLAMAAEDGVVKGDKFVPLVDDKIFITIDAVGEPNIELKLLSLKFLGKAVFTEEKPFTIDDSRRAKLAIDSVTLP